MAPFASLLSTLLLASCATAHFHVRTPAPLGTTTEKENVGPCGGETADFSKEGTDFHVGGDAIALSSGHPVTQWGFRITTDEKAEGNWTEIYQQVEQQGPGNFCLPKVSVPESWVGKKALLNIVSTGDDGMLFQVPPTPFPPLPRGPQLTGHFFPTSLVLSGQLCRWHRAEPAIRMQERLRHGFVQKGPRAHSCAGSEHQDDNSERFGC